MRCPDHADRTSIQYIHHRIIRNDPSDTITAQTKSLGCRADRHRMREHPFHRSRSDHRMFKGEVLKRLVADEHQIVCQDRFPNSRQGCLVEHSRCRIVGMGQHDHLRARCDQRFQKRTVDLITIFRLQLHEDRPGIGHRYVLQIIGIAGCRYDDLIAFFQKRQHCKIERTVTARGDDDIARRVQRQTIACFPVFRNAGAQMQVSGRCGIVLPLRSFDGAQGRCPYMCGNGIIRLKRIGPAHHIDTGGAHRFKTVTDICFLHAGKQTAFKLLKCFFHLRLHRTASCASFAMR